MVRRRPAERSILTTFNGAASLSGAAWLICIRSAVDAVAATAAPVLPATSPADGVARPRSERADMSLCRGDSSRLSDTTGGAVGVDGRSGAAVALAAVG